MGLCCPQGEAHCKGSRWEREREQEARGELFSLARVSVAIGFLILILGLLFLEPLCGVLGATPVIMKDCKIYLGVLLGFGPLTMLQMFFQVFFVTAGNWGWDF